MAAVGETKLRPKCNRMLMKLYTPSMPSRISMYGQRDDKLAFMNTEVSRILINVAIKTSPAEENVTEAKVEASLASILRGAPLRKAAKLKN